MSKKQIKVTENRTTIQYLEGGDYKEEMTVPSSCPIQGYIQYEHEAAQPKYSLSYKAVDGLCFRAAPEDLNIDPYLRTYKVSAYGTFTKPVMDPVKEYDLVGKFRVLEEIHYREVVKMKAEAGGFIKSNSARNLYFEELWAGNIGVNNCGCRNVGFSNLGIANQGVKCTGVYNKGYNVLGAFNTSAACFYMFNKPVPKGTGTWLDVNDLLPAFLQKQFKCGEPDVFEERAEKYEQLTLMEAFKEAAKQEDWPKQYKELTALPNFDYGIFEEITGISKKMLDEANKAWKKKYGKKGK